jgi:hypothetical protein
MSGGYGASPIEVLAREAMRQGAVYCEKFDLTARFLAGSTSALAANNSQTVPVQIDNGWDFVIQSINGTWYNADGTTLNAAPNALVQFIKDTSGKLLSSAPEHWLNVMGSFAANKISDQLPFPVLLAEKSTLQVTLTNLTADAPNRVEISLVGFKVYYVNTSRSDLFHVQF